MSAPDSPTPERRRHALRWAVAPAVVVVLVAGLVKMVAPNISDGPGGSPESISVCNLIMLRQRLELYRVQHHEHVPDERILAQLLQGTDERGDPGAERGPYLNAERPFPAVAMTGVDRVTVVDSMPEIPQGTGGWIYATDTGELRIDLRGTGPSGVAWFDF